MAQAYITAGGVAARGSRWGVVGQQVGQHVAGGVLWGWDGWGGVGWGSTTAWQWQLAHSIACPQLCQPHHRGAAPALKGTPAGLKRAEEVPIITVLHRVGGRVGGWVDGRAGGGFKHPMGGRAGGRQHSPHVIVYTKLLTAQVASQVQPLP